MLSVWVQKTTEQIEVSPSGAQVTRPPLYLGDLEEDRPHKIISQERKPQNEEASNFTEAHIQEMIKQKETMIQWSPGFDDPDQSICEAAGASRERDVSSYEFRFKVVSGARLYEVIPKERALQPADFFLTLGNCQEP